MSETHASSQVTNRLSPGFLLIAACALVAGVSCGREAGTTEGESPRIEPDFVLRGDQTHDKFSRRIEPVLRVPSGSVIEAFTQEATGGQFTIDSTDPTDVDMDLVHTLTGPVYVEGAEPGDVLAVELLEIEVGDWGWMAIIPQFGVLEEFQTRWS